MIGGAKRRVRALVESVEDWPEVPAEARAFHGARRRLRQDLDDAASRWFVGKSESVDSLAERARWLGQTAKALTALLRRRREADELVGELTRLAARDGDPAIVGWVDERAGAWRLELARLIDSCRRPADVDAEQRRLEAVWADMVEVRGALQLLISAAERFARDASPSTSDAPDASVDPLGAYRKRLITGDADATWRVELEAETERQQARVETPTDDPRVRQRLDATIARLWEWAPSTPDQRAAIAALSERAQARSAVGARRLDDAAVGEAALDALLDEASGLLESIETDAADARRARRRALDERLQALALLTVESDLEARFAELVERTVDGPRAHREWLAACDALDSRFLDRLQNDHRRVDVAFAEALGEVREGLVALRARPLGRQVAMAVETAAAEVGQLADAVGVEARFAALARLRVLGETLAGLDERATEERTRHDVAVQALGGRVERLRRLLAEQVEVARMIDPGTLAVLDAEPLPEPLPDLDHALDAARAAYDERDADVRRAEATFIAACETARRRIAEADRRLAVALDLAVGVELLTADALPAAAVDGPSPGPAEAATALDAARARSEALRGAFEVVCDAAQARFPAALRALEGLDPSRLRAGDRGLRDELLDTARSTAAATLETFNATIPESAELSGGLDEVEVVLAWFRRRADLVERVEGARRRSAERRRSLVERLDRLDAERLADVCPERLVERLHALVHGLDDEVLDGEIFDAADVGHQLAEAERLADRLEHHARWRLAGEIERARRRLVGDPSPAARALLTELAAQPIDGLPSIELRRRLADAIPSEVPP